MPPTGTAIHTVNDEILNELLLKYLEQIFYLGHVYGSAPKLPLWFKHFDRGREGAGEAYHLGIFGKTGSGKSVLAKMILLAYARYPKMSLLVIDPQGEFAKDIRPGGSQSEFRSRSGILRNGWANRVMRLPFETSSSIDGNSSSRFSPNRVSSNG